MWKQWLQKTVPLWRPFSIQLPEPLFYTLSEPEPGKRMAYRVYGAAKDKPKPAVLCVHGLGQQGSSFHFLAQRLAKTHTVYAVDVVGRGNSDYLDDPAHYSLPHYVLHLKAFIRDVIQGQPVHWVGTSMGGLVGLLMTAEPAVKLSSLILNDIGTTIPAKAQQAILQYADGRFQFESVQDLINHYRPFLKPSKMSLLERGFFLEQALVALPEGGFRLPYDPNIMVNFRATASQDLDYSVYWQERALPTLVIHGAQSDLLTTEILQDMRAVRPFDLITVQEAGHAPAFVEPLNGDVGAWLLGV